MGLPLCKQLLLCTLLFNVIFLGTQLHTKKYHSVKTNHSCALSQASCHRAFMNSRLLKALLHIGRSRDAIALALH